MKKYIVFFAFVAAVLVFKIFSVETFEINRDKHTYMSIYSAVLYNAYNILNIDSDKFPDWGTIGKPYGIGNYCGAGGPFFDTKERESSQYTDVTTKTGGGAKRIKELYNELTECRKEGYMDVSQRIHFAKTAAYLGHYIININLPYYVAGGTPLEEKRGIFNVKDWQEPFPAEHKEFVELIKGQGKQYPEFKNIQDFDPWPGNIEEYIWFCGDRAKKLGIAADFEEYRKTGDENILRSIIMKADTAFENASRAVRTVWMQAYRRNRNTE